MKRIIFALILLLSLTIPVMALSSSVNYNGKVYYKVTSTDSTDDSGDEVCAKAGMVFAGYTDTTSDVCLKFNPNAATSSSMSGDSSGVYCDGLPQSGVCAGLMNVCHICPSCTTSVRGDQAIGGLYREMYAECQPVSSSGGACSIVFTARDVASLIAQVPSLNAQLQTCPVTLPSGTGTVIANGVTQIDINMNNGQIQSMVMTVTNGQITDLQVGTTSSCKQKVTVSENDVNVALSSSNLAQAATYLVGQGKVSVSGCSFLSKARLFFVQPVAKFIAKRNAPTPPPAPPAPNCGQVGEQCNNRGCFSGMCGAPKEQNSNGQWGYWNYRCIDQNTYTANCVGRGNTPPAWSCLTGICQ